MEAITLSASAIAAYKRCPKSFQLGYELGLQPTDTVKDYVQQGSDFHRLVYLNALGKKADMDAGYGLIEEVAHDYLRARPLPDDIISAEEPLYTMLMPSVYIRTTHDLVYRKGETIVGRDYKTFDKAPTLDLDLDFQGRVYIASLQRQFPDNPIEFEYEYVRRVPPGTRNSKGYWTAQECYLTFPLIISRREADAVWEETQWVAEAIIEARKKQRFWRTDLKGSSPHTCGTCFYRNLCKAEMEHGELTDQDLAILSPQRREPDHYLPT